MVRTVRIYMDSAELTIVDLRAFHVPRGENTHPMETWDSSTEHICVSGPWCLPIITLHG